MAGFIAEFRPKCTDRLPSPVTYKPAGHVADFRLKQRPNSKLPGGDFTGVDTSIHHVHELLAAKSFTREQNLDLLTSSVLTLIKRLLLSRPIKSIEGSISVALDDDPHPLVVNLKEICENNNYDYLTEAATDVKVKVTDAGVTQSPLDVETRHLYPNARERTYLPEEVHPGCLDFVPNERKSSFDSSYSSSGSLYDSRSLDSHSPDHCRYELLDSPLDCGIKARVSPPLRRPEVEEVVVRRDSDEESGYTSSEKDDAETGVEHESEDMECAQDDKAFCPEEAAMSVDAERVGPAQVVTVVPENEAGPVEGPGILVSPQNDAETARNDEAIDEDASDEELVIDLSVQPEENGQRLGSNSTEVNAQTGFAVGTLKHSETEQNKVLMNVTNEKGCVVPTQEREPLKDDLDRAYGVCAAETSSETDSPFSDWPSSTEPDVASTDSDMPATDSEFPVDLSGDKIAKENEAGESHPFVSKLSRGVLCKKCCTLFPNSVAFAAHSRDAHGLFSCKFCCKTFTAKNNLKRHDRIHTGAKPYKCSQCDQSFARRDDLKAHHLRHDYSKPFRCSVCSKGYTDRACVKNHMAKEHGSKLMHVCPQCGESFDRDDAFTLHKKSHPELRQYSCKTCSFIGNNNLMTLKHSLHHVYKLFSCRPCNAYFGDPFDYTNHVRKHKRNPAFTSYICCFCDICLPTYDQFVRHEYSHAHCKVHPCGYCSKQFKSKSLLQQHMQTHEYTKTASQAAKGDLEELPCDTEEYKFDVKESGQDNLPETVKETEPQWSHDDIQNSAERMKDKRPLGHEEVLDLSMKKQSPLPNPSNEREDPYASSSSVASAGPSGLQAVCAPRNGCSPESAGLNLAQIVDVRELLSSSPAAREGSFCEKTFKVIANRRDDVVRMVMEKRSQERAQLSPEIDENAPGKSLFTRKCSNGDYSKKGAFRFGPYNRNKLVDFTSKFLAARGLEMRLGKAVTTKPKDYRNTVNDGEKSMYRETGDYPLLAVNKNITQTRTGDVSRIDGAQPKVVVGLCGKEITPSSLPLNRDDDGAASRSLLPTFIKSESLLESNVKPTPNAAAFTKPVFVSNQASNDAHHHSSGGSNKCELCQESFASFQELENHSVSEHKRFLCEHCGKSFTARPNRDRHVRYHTGERPYKCDLCDMAFFRGDDLKYHRTTRHPTAQPSVCNRCSTTFTWHRDLERHIRHSKCKAPRG